MTEIVDGNVSLNDMKDAAVEDLLDREPIRVNMEEIYSYISGRPFLLPVLAMVPTYHPAVAGSAAKGETYEALIRQAVAVH